MTENCSPPQEPSAPAPGSDPNAECVRSAPRIGITASRKVGNAVVRNRFKRRIRDWFRHNRGEIDSNLDIVVIARPSGSRLSYAELDARLSRLLDITEDRA